MRYVVNAIDAEGELVNDGVYDRRDAARLSFRNMCKALPNCTVTGYDTAYPNDDPPLVLWQRSVK